MILKNPDKLLRQFIPSATGNLIWSATNVNVTMDDEITYIFEFYTQIPVKSSPNQQYYSIQPPFALLLLNCFRFGFRIAMYIHTTIRC